MTAIRRFEEIEAWQTARELTRWVYNHSGDGNFSRDFGLRDQIRRASISVMSNIAEGFESQSTPLFLRYLGYAKASSGEVRAQLYIALDCGYLDQEEFHYLSNLAEKCSSQIYRFIQYLRKNKR
jgi:four helix bundle protein